MSNDSTKTLRFSELKPGSNGLLKTEWYLTSNKLAGTVKIVLPPCRAIPIIFVPGIMGSNLCNLKGNPVWLLNSSVKDIPAGLALEWATKKAGARQSILHPDRTKVYASGAVPEESFGLRISKEEYLKRGWGEVSEASYHKFLLWLNEKMNANRNPEHWSDFLVPSIGGEKTSADRAKKKLQPGLPMDMLGLPQVAERGYGVHPIKTDDLLARSKSMFPLYAFGYNWLASNSAAAAILKDRIEKIIAENNSRSVRCTQVILITHSMGGLVARACSLLPEMSKKIAGIVHGVMPATGAAVAYRRCKVGMKDEDRAAGLVIGSDGKEVTAVFAQAPGALQLLPSEDYGENWLHVADAAGNTIKSLPSVNPYEEIYLERKNWWGLIKEEWLNPEDGAPISWRDFSKNIKLAQDFHRKISKKYHAKTFVFYGGGDAKGSFSKIRWEIKKGKMVAKGAAPPLTDVFNMGNKDIRTDGSNNLYVGGESIMRSWDRGDMPVVMVTESSHWEIKCARQDSSGDGTVPASSGSAPRQVGGGNILQQFELPGITHEPAYRDFPVARQVAYYALTKIAAVADLS